MKHKLTVFIAGLMALVLVLCACSSDTSIKSTEEESRVVGKVGGYDIRHEELRYLTLGYKEALEVKYGEGLFDDDAGARYEEMLMELVSAQLIENYAYIELFKTKGIKLSDKQIKNEVEEYVQAFVAELGDSEIYQEYLKNYYMTDWVFRQNAAVFAGQEKYYEILAKDQHEQAKEAVLSEEGIIRCKSIFIQNDPGERLAANRADAQMVRDAIAAGASIDDYMGTKYNQDPQECDYYFMSGYFIQEYEDAAFALEIGEVSDVVEVLEGFYVIQRFPTDATYLKRNYDNLEQIYHICTMEHQMQEIAKTLSFTLNEGVTLWSMQ